MKCNQKFFGQEHFEEGSPERARCLKFAVLKPAMAQYDFAIRDHLPTLPTDEGGVVQLKYNGMFSIVLWDSGRKSFVAWSTRGRCYYSLDDERRHPVIEYFNSRFPGRRDLAFVGETYAVRQIRRKCFMTEFNETMSVIKNPKAAADVNRIRLAVFDYAENRDADEFTRSDKGRGYIERFKRLRDYFKIPVGCDGHVVHLPDHLVVNGSFQDSYGKVQEFWNEYVGHRGFEGVVLYANSGTIFKVKFRDTLDAVIIAFRKAGHGRPVCEACGAKFDALWLRKLSEDGTVVRSKWFAPDGRLLHGKNDVWNEDLPSCPICEGRVSNTSGPILGAKIALMTPNGDFLDIADGVQLSPLSPMLELVEPLYESEGYLWVKPEVVVEISYQDLYLDRLRPVYQYRRNHYRKIGVRKAVSLRPYRPRHRKDKSVTPRDLRLEQLNYFVNRIERIKESWRAEREQKDLSQFISQENASLPLKR